MQTFPLAAVSFLMSVIAVLFVIVCLVLVLVILIQKGKGGGLSAAFGGLGAGGLLGTKTGDFLTWVTIAVTALFLFLAIIMGLYYKPRVTELDTAHPAATVPAAPTLLKHQATPPIPQHSSQICRTNNKLKIKSLPTG